MSIGIEDGFNFAIGEWLAEWAIAGIGLIILVVVFLTIYSIVFIHDVIVDWIWKRQKNKRKVKE